MIVLAYALLFEQVFFHPIRSFSSTKDVRERNEYEIYLHQNTVEKSDLHHENRRHPLLRF